MAKTRDFARVIRKKLASDPDLAAAVEQESFNADIALEIYEARKEAGLTQKQLADRIGSHQSVIARLEAADYDGHSLTMLKRIADALKKRLKVGFYSRFRDPTEVPTMKISVWEDTDKWKPQTTTRFTVKENV